MNRGRRESTGRVKERLRALRYRPSLTRSSLTRRTAPCQTGDDPILAIRYKTGKVGHGRYRKRITRRE